MSSGSDPSPFILIGTCASAAATQQDMDVTLSAPGHQAVTLSFDANRQEGIRK